MPCLCACACVRACERVFWLVKCRRCHAGLQILAEVEEGAVGDVLMRPSVPC